MRRSSGGFTLIELLLSLAILSVVVAGISTVLVKQTQASAVQVAQRDLEESGRLALVELGRAVRLAGYGIDPSAAFDFARYACGTPDTPATCNGGGRDRLDAPDEMVVAWRDPAFSRRVTSLAGTGPWTVQLDAPLTAPIGAGRIVQLICDGAGQVGYFALDSDAAPPSGGGPQQLSLRALTAADGFFTSVDPIANGCFAGAVATLVERTRYYIGIDSGVPSLFRDRGRGQELLFRGIEDLQLSYDIGQPPPGSPFATGGPSAVAAPGCAISGNATWSFGSCPGAAGSPLHTATAPDWRNDPYDSVNRYTANPMNIRAVHVALVARATQVSPDGTGDDVPALLNRPARARDGYHRAVFTLVERPANLLSRAYMLPPIAPGSNNLGGG